MYYVIGDVHGNYELLMELESQLLSDAELIFVGDLIDRGLNSKDVISFIRENSCLCVRGNHDEYMVKQLFKTPSQWEEDLDFYEWLESGGIMTLLSYGISGEYADFFTNPENRNHIFFNDAKWLSALPYYIELDSPTINGRKIVISHSSIGNRWNERNQNSFKNYVTNNRTKPVNVEGIYNIYGHTPSENVKVGEYSASIDTGAYYSKKLSALEIPTLKIITTEV